MFRSSFLLTIINPLSSLSSSQLVSAGTIIFRPDAVSRVCPHRPFTLLGWRHSWRGYPTPRCFPWLLYRVTYLEKGNGSKCHRRFLPQRICTRYPTLALWPTSVGSSVSSLSTSSRRAENISITHTSDLVQRYGQLAFGHHHIWSSHPL